MMIDIPHVRDIRPKLPNHSTKLLPRFRRIDRMCRAPGFFPEPAFLLEIDRRHEVLIISSRLAARIGHGEERHLVPARAQQLHQFEQINLGTAERKVIFVAKQDPHQGCSRSAVISALGIGLRTSPNSSCHGNCSEPARKPHAAPNRGFRHAPFRIDLFASTNGSHATAPQSHPPIPAGTEIQSSPLPLTLESP